MKRSYLLIGGVLGGLTALIVAVLSELASSLLGLPGIAFSLFDWMARHLPGPIITFFIDTMVKTISALQLGPTALVAKRIEQGMAVVVFIGIGVVFGVILAAAGRRKPEQLASFGMWGGLILLMPILAILVSLGFGAAGPLISAIWLVALFMGWGWTLGKLIQYLVWPSVSSEPEPTRRRFLYLVGAGSFTILVSSVG